MGFVQDMEEVPLHDPVAFQLLQRVTATVPPAVTLESQSSWKAGSCSPAMNPLTLTLH